MKTGRTFERSRVGLVFQEFELLDYLDVLDNVLLPYRVSPALDLDDAARRRASELVEQVGLAGKSSTRFPGSCRRESANAWPCAGRW